jgi:hypothetical protein
MLDVEPLLIAELERFASASLSEPDWGGVLTRVGKTNRRVSRRRVMLVVAAFAAVAVLVVAVAAAAGFGVFSNWLTGQPGKPVSAAAQRAFDHATRSWQGFPRTARLRRLAEVTVGQATYTLYGFRGAGSLCLRLAVSGKPSGTDLACAPLSELRSRTSPALVLVNDLGIGSTNTLATYGPLTNPTARATVSFGVVADGVTEIEVRHQNKATTRTIVSGDAFLSISDRLSPFNPTTTVTATADGKRATVPFAASLTPFGQRALSAQPAALGPAKVERAVKGGAIRWFAHRQPRGEPVPATIHHIVGVLPSVIFSRLITPDPSLPERMVVSIRPAGTVYFGGRLRNNRQVCAELVGGRYQGGGCWPAGRLFSTEPFSWGVEVQTGGQIATVSGLASDQVTRITLYTATGRVAPVPLHDNAYLTVASLADYPLRLVAYDAQGEIIGVKTFKTNNPPPSAAPKPGARWRRVLTNKAGSIYTIPSTSGGTCVGFRYTDGTAAISCIQSVAGNQAETLALGTSRDQAGQSILSGIAGHTIARIAVSLENGQTISAKPIDGYFLLALPRSGSATQTGNIQITGYDPAGRPVTHLELRAPPPKSG